MKSFFLVPGRLISKLLGGEKKRALRSPRQRSEASLGLVVISLIFWVAFGASLVFLLNSFFFSGGTTGSKVEVPSPSEAVSAVAAEGQAGQKSLATTENTGKVAAASSLVVPIVTPQVSPERLVAVEQWLVILHTIPKPKNGRDEAERRKANYQTRGLGVDILDTDAFPRLRSGSWIIALGPFEDRAIAYRMAEEAKSYNSKLIVRRGL